LIELIPYVSAVGGEGGNGREELSNSVVYLVSHLSRVCVTLVLCHIHKLSARCKFNLNLWRGLLFKFCFTFGFSTGWCFIPRWSSNSRWR